MKKEYFSPLTESMPVRMLGVLMESGGSTEEKMQGTPYTAPARGDMPSY